MIILFLVSLVITILPTSRVQALSGSEFQAGRIIDDQKFFSSPPMTAAEIQTFLNAKVPTCDTNGTQAYGGTTRAAYAASRGVSTPFTCLKSYQTTTTAKPAEAGLCNAIGNSGASAAEVIYTVAQSCGVNPQVLIVLLQKEQSLITDDWPWPIQYQSATGYGCPDTAPCDTEYYGFFNQVYNAARQFKRYKKDANLFNFRAGLNANIQYNPNAGCGSSSVYIQNAATAALYNYTPYQPNQAALNNLYGTGDGCSAYGNRNFWRMFIDWFGSTYGPPDYSCRGAANIPGSAKGEKVVTNKLGGPAANLSLIIHNNTSTACAEVHTWTSSMQQWTQHVATNSPSIDPAYSEIISADLDGDNRSEMIVVNYQNTGSGRIELHIWDSTYQKWVAHIATNRPQINAADARVIAGDSDGDGRDELGLVEYRNTASGRVEYHRWSSNFQQWTQHIATNYTSINPADGMVMSADLDGDGRDEFYMVHLQNTHSGKVEVHGWTSNFQQWVSHIATSHDVLSSADNTVVANDSDGDRRDELVLIRYRGTASGRIEAHRWASNLQQWVSHIAATP